MIQWQEILIRLSLAAFLGAIIGMERERKDWSAGMRTHMMVCVGASLIMLVSTFGFKDILGTPGVGLDPSRIAAQVVSGIGFIGAGTIMFLRQGVIRGLTTASGLWTVAAIGLACGSGMYFAAGVTTMLAIFILWVLQPLERRLARRFRHRNVVIHLSADMDPQSIIHELEENTVIETLNLLKTKDDITLNVQFENVSKKEISFMENLFSKNENVKEVYWPR